MHLAQNLVYKVYLPNVFRTAIRSNALCGVLGLLGLIALSLVKEGIEIPKDSVSMEKSEKRDAKDQRLGVKPVMKNLAHVCCLKENFYNF